MTRRLFGKLIISMAGCVLARTPLAGFFEEAGIVSPEVRVAFFDGEMIIPPGPVIYATPWVGLSAVADRLYRNTKYDPDMWVSYEGRTMRRSER